MDRPNIPRKAQAHAVGLPEDATWEEIAQRKDEIFRVSAAIARGLSYNTSWENIFRHDDDLAKGRIAADIFRVNSALGRGLPRSATWCEIRSFDNRKDFPREPVTPPLRDPIFVATDLHTWKQKL